MGGMPAVRIGGPPAINDLYYWIMEMSWPAFVGLATAVFLLLNTIFGLLYAAIPGSIANAAPGSLIDGFFFSVDTLATVGYGQMYPASTLGHGLAVVEILVGLFFSATITGLIFARFARPRVAVMFSKVAVLGRFGDRRALMVRVAALRSHPLADATAQLSWLRIEHPDGGKPFRSLIELPLLKSRNPLLALAWTLIHIVESDEDEILKALHGNDRFMLTVTVSATDTLLDNPTQASARYDRHQIRIGHQFVDMISDEDGAMQVDVGLLHHTIEDHFAERAD